MCVTMLGRISARGPRGWTAFFVVLVTLGTAASTPALAWYEKKSTWPETMQASRRALNRLHPRTPGFEPHEGRVLRGGDKPEQVSINVEGVNRLWLVADPTKDGNGADQAVWGEPVLVAKDGSRTRLTKVAPIFFKVGYGNRPKVNHNYKREKLRFGQRELEHGFWAHAPSAMCFALNGRYARFETWVGIDAAAERRGSVKFTVTDRNPDAAKSGWSRMEQDFPVHADWFLQDCGQEPSAWFWASTRAEIETAILGKVLGELGPAGADLQTALDRLVQQRVPAGDVRWLQLYEKGCKLRRALRLRPLLKAHRKIVFVKYDDRAVTGANHFAYTESLSDTYAHGYFTFRPGSALCVLEMNGEGGRVRTLLEDPGGVIRDPDVSFDGRRILFSWKKSAKEDDYHLYEMDVPSGAVRQLTFGLGYADFEGIYLPNGDILFNSSRCIQEVDCDVNEVSNLYLCNADGKYIRRVGFDQVHTNHPTLLADGRVVYTRWDYNDRSQIWPQGLFQMNPDGTGQAECYGNNSWFPTAILHARGIPGTTKLLAVLGGHHAHQRGKLAIINPHPGNQEAAGVQLVAPVRKTAAVRQDVYGQDGEQFKYPYPIRETAYLASYTPYHLGNRAYGRPFWLYFFTAAGQRELLAWDGTKGCYHAVPLGPRPRPQVRPDQVDYHSEKGVYLLQDIYQGPGLAGIPRGTVKKLRVVALLYRPANIGVVACSGPGGASAQRGPVAIGNGTYDAKMVLGSATVHEDGSASFEVPARTPVYFQALDARGHVVQSMRSWSTLQPGERLGCVGCHEHKNTAPPAGPVPIAMRKEPQKLEPFYGPPRGFSFPKEIQPILDRHCTRCHDQKGATTPRKDEKTFSLLATPNAAGPSRRTWSDAYIALTDAKDDVGHPNKIVNWLNVQSVPSPLPPYYAGSSESKLIAMLDEGHRGVKLSKEDRDKIACWIDLLVPYCGDYAEANAWNEAEKKKYDYYLKKRRRAEAQERENIAALRSKTK